jgi:hypothetical protein
MFTKRPAAPQDPLGRIPWQRRTVTPASLLHSSNVECVFDGAAS